VRATGDNDFFASKHQIATNLCKTQVAAFKLEYVPRAMSSMEATVSHTRWLCVTRVCCTPAAAPWVDHGCVYMQDESRHVCMYNLSMRAEAKSLGGCSPKAKMAQSRYPLLAREEVCSPPTCRSCRPPVSVPLEKTRRLRYGDTSVTGVVGNTKPPPT